jgi:phosphoglucomutase
MAMFYKDRHMTLPQALEALYETYGHYEEQVISITIGGTDPSANMARIMSSLRAQLPTSVGGVGVQRVGDFKKGEYIEGERTYPTGLPKSDVLHFLMEDGCTVIIRPSGTEPKVKLYILACGDSRDDCGAKVALYKNEFGEMLK